MCLPASPGGFGRWWGETLLLPSCHPTRPSDTYTWVVRARPGLPPFLIYANLHLEISGTMYAKLLVCKKLGRVDWTSTVRKMPRKKRRLRLKVRVHTLASRQLHQMKEKKITSQLNRQISWLTCEVDRLKLKKIPTLKQKNLALRLERTLGYKTLPELEDILMAKNAQLKSEVLRRRHLRTVVKAQRQLYRQSCLIEVESGCLGPACWGYPSLTMFHF